MTGRTRTGAAGTTAPSAASYTTATAGTTGIEPAASRLTSERSTHLSYAPRWRERGRDSNPRSRAHEAREDSRSSTAQVWLAGIEPAISGFQGRWGGQLPHSQQRELRIDNGPGRHRTCTFPVKSRVLCRRLSYGAVQLM